MDLINELKEIKQKSAPVKDLLEQVRQEQIVLEKKFYVLQVLDCAKKIAEVAQSGLIPTKRIPAMNLYYYSDHDDKGFSFHFVDAIGRRISTSVIDRDHRDAHKNVEEIFLELKIVNTNYFNEEFKSEGLASVALTGDVEKNILNTLLNKELQTVLQYSEMQSDLESTEVSQKKHKL